MPEKNNKKSKRTGTSNEAKGKEEYNRTELLKRERRTQSKSNKDMKNKEKGIKNFFKKFFD